ncbi:MAG TPA: hypothetical protein VNQ90_05460 [Chthoniobacteraceae bacterium]|nr:hypothetical protein [Chthoniobacteraceae bacterium]
MKAIVAKILFRLFLLALLGAGLWLWFALSPVRHAPGVLVVSPPIRTAPGSTAARPSLQLKPVENYTLRDVGGLRLAGRVLAAKRYRDAQARLAPLDVLIGWGPMSDSTFVRQLTIEQGERTSTVQWKGEEPPLPPGEIAASSLHLHLIPADREIATFLGELKVGTLVDFRGTIVEAEKGDFHWRSTPGDDRNAARELFLLQRAGVFDGNQNLAEKEARDQLADARDNLNRWYQCLAEQRAKLDPNDAEAVHAFNREAQRYMEAAHPEAADAP